MQYQEKVGKKEIPKLLERKKQQYSKPSVIRPSENFTFYGVTKTKTGDAEVSIALKIIMEDGSQLVIQYHEINSPMRYNGADTIELYTPTLSIKIIGNNLDILIDYLAEQRLVWIKEPDSDFSKTDEEEPEIEKIDIEEKNT